MIDHEFAQPLAPPVHAQRLESVARPPTSDNQLGPDLIEIHDRLPHVRIEELLVSDGLPGHDLGYDLPLAVGQRCHARHRQDQRLSGEDRKIGLRQRLCHGDGVIALEQGQALRQRRDTARWFLVHDGHGVLDVHPVDVPQPTSQTADGLA